VQYIGERRVTTKTTQLIRLLDDPSGDVREAAAEALTEARTPESHAALRRALTNADADVRRIAVEYFGEGDDQ
jgi:HEAT repeat protein